MPGLREFSLNTIGLHMPLKLLNPGSGTKTHPFRAFGQVMKALSFQRILYRECHFRLFEAFIS